MPKKQKMKHRSLKKFHSRNVNASAWEFKVGKARRGMKVNQNEKTTIWNNFERLKFGFRSNAMWWRKGIRLLATKFWKKWILSSLGIGKALVNHVLWFRWMGTFSGDSKQRCAKVKNSVRESGTRDPGTRTAVMPNKEGVMSRNFRLDFWRPVSSPLGWTFFKKEFVDEFRIHLGLHLILRRAIFL